jgi:hypothetical protein
MHKHLFPIAALLMAGSVFAESPNPGSDLANAGIAADLGSTAIGLSMGMTESNPLGLALIPLKFIVKARIDKIENDHERREATAQFTGLQFAAGAANLCTLAVANPAFAALCFAGGMAYGYMQVKAIPTESECVQRHMAKLQEAVASGRTYRVTVKSCQGQFDADPIVAQVSTATP